MFVVVVSQFCGLGIWIGHSRDDLSLLLDVWSLSWGDEGLLGAGTAEAGRAARCLFHVASPHGLDWASHGAVAPR